MSLVRNKSGGRLDVTMLDRSVEDGETVEVPDFQPGSTDENPLPVVWPPDKWEPVDLQPGPEPSFVTAHPGDDEDGA